MPHADVPRQRERQGDGERGRVSVFGIPSGDMWSLPRRQGRIEGGPIKPVNPDAASRHMWVILAGHKARTLKLRQVAPLAMSFLRECASNPALFSVSRILKKACEQV